MTEPLPLVASMRESADHMRLIPAETGRQDVELSWASSRLIRGADRIEALERALAQAADNLEAGDRLYTCPGLHKAAQLARAALATAK